MPVQTRLCAPPRPRCTAGVFGVPSPVATADRRASDSLPSPRASPHMNLRTKILLIVAVMGAVVAFTAGMVVYTTNVYSRQVAELEAASSRAFNGEHLNRLVTAVVMDA